MPDLNPDEGVWGWTKYGHLANLAANDKDELWGWVVEELITVKHRPDLLKGFIRQMELPGLSLAAAPGPFTRLEPGIPGMRMIGPCPDCRERSCIFRSVNR